MNNRIANRQVLTAGLTATLIFIVFSTNYTVHGGEADQTAAAQRSRLHPKRIFSGIKRGFSKVFRGSGKKIPVLSTAEPSVPRPTVSEQINNIYTDRGLQTSSPKLKPKRTPSAPPMPQVKLSAPHKVISTAQVNKSVFDDWDGPEITKTTRVRKAKPIASGQISQATAQPKQAPEIKHLLGYCSVNLKYGKFRRGKQTFREQYQGRTYTFDSTEALQEFRRNPAPYAPALQGIDVVELTHTGHHTEGYLSFSCDYDGHFYFFRSQENQEEFLANPAAYAVP